MSNFFKQFAEMLEDQYGAYFDREEGFVECPECGNEPIYDEDWQTEEYMEYTADGYRVWRCPICGTILIVEDIRE